MNNNYLNPIWWGRKAALYSRSYLSLRKEDMVLALYPKTGSTWIRFFYYNLLSIHEKGQTDTAIDEMNRMMPEFGHSSMFSPWPFASRRLVKTHRPRNLLMTGRPVVLVVRDPRDIVVSYYHYLVNKKEIDFSGTVNDVLRDRQYGLPAFFRHYNSWRSSAGLVLRYEDLRENPEDGFTQLAEFVGVQASEAEIRSAIEASIFEKMRQAQAESDAFRNKFEKGFVFARSGASAQWRELFEEEDLEYWNQMKKENHFELYE